MTVSPTRNGAGTPIPPPRSAEPEFPEPPAVRSPWPESWRPAPGARPRTEFWNVTTAGWECCGPLPRPED